MVYNNWQHIMINKLKRWVLGIPQKQMTFSYLGIKCEDSARRDYLENIIRVFAGGYHASLVISDKSQLVHKLDNENDNHHVGFSYEGVGMHLALIDLVMFWGKSRLRQFTESVGKKHGFIVTVGAGFAIGRLPWGPALIERYMKRLDPLSAWCVPDGYGFHEGVFHHTVYIESCSPPPRSLPDYTHQLFDSGIGRSMWWVLGSSPSRIKSAIDRFPEARQSELWCGIGVACSYAGGVDEETLLALRQYSGTYMHDFLSGLPFASHMRVDAGNPSGCTDLACNVLLGISANETATLLADVLDIELRERLSDKHIREKLYGQVRKRLRQNISQLVV